MARPQKWEGLGAMEQANVRIPLTIYNRLVAHHGSIQKAINKLIIEPEAVKIEIEKEYTVAIKI